MPMNMVPFHRRKNTAECYALILPPKSTDFGKSVAPGNAPAEFGAFILIRAIRVIRGQIPAKTWQDLAELVKKWQNGTSWDRYELSSMLQTKGLRKKNPKTTIEPCPPARWKLSNVSFARIFQPRPIRGVRQFYLARHTLCCHPERSESSSAVKDLTGGRKRGTQKTHRIVCKMRRGSFRGVGSFDFARRLATLRMTTYPSCQKILPHTIRDHGGILFVFFVIICYFYSRVCATFASGLYYLGGFRIYEST